MAEPQSPEQPKLKVSKNPVVQQQVEKHEESIQSKFMLPPEAARHFARKATADEIRIQRLRDRSLTDELTGLPNEKWFRQELRMKVAYYNRQMRGKQVPFDLLENHPDLPPSILIIVSDYDKFKDVNDSFGHDGGDKGLQLMAKLETREEEPIVRLHGEEFAQVAVGHFTQETIARMIERQSQQLEEASMELYAKLPVDPKKPIETPIPTMQTASFGITFYRPGEPIEVTLKRADMALYQAKTLGRDRAVYALTLDSGNLEDISYRTISVGR